MLGKLSLAVCFAVAAVAASNLLSAAEPVRIDVATASVLNSHADQVGIWVNSIDDVARRSYAERLRSLRLRSIRYGWQFAVLDPKDLSKQRLSVDDPNLDLFFAPGGNSRERFGPAAVGKLLGFLGASGFAVVSTDAIGYTGAADEAFGSLSPPQRKTRMASAAADWARWGRQNGFECYEIGNENDLSGEGDKADFIRPWTPERYATVASTFMTAIKGVDPNARCGINGGLRDDAATTDWFARIARAAPTLKQQTDFLVCHKYEMWLDHDTWRDHPEWDFGRVGQSFRQVRDEHFPTAAIHVTEIGPWKDGENHHHYRSLLGLEMLGNVRMDAEVKHVQFWPTRWGKDGIFRPVTDPSADAQNADRLSSMGLGLAAYTRFVRDDATDVGSQGPIRYFASSDDRGVTVTLINHAPDPVDVRVRLDRRIDLRNPDVWRLRSATNDPMADDTELVSDRGDRFVAAADDGRTFEARIGGTAALIITASKADR